MPAQTPGSQFCARTTENTIKLDKIFVSFDVFRNFRSKSHKNVFVMFFDVKTELNYQTSYVNRIS